MSIYLYNEYRGFHHLERLSAALREHFPEEVEFLAAVEKHASDERKHYQMFRRWFELRGEMPFALGPSVGYIDLFVDFVFGTPLDRFDVQRAVRDEQYMFRLFRLIMLTEARGLKQVDALLDVAVIRESPRLSNIFKIVQRDEPSHFLPYQAWLEKRGRHVPTLGERLAELRVHWWLVMVKFPSLLLNPYLRRSERYPS
jgi:hypothetical protein